MPGVPPTRFVYLGPESTFTEQALLTIPAAERGIRKPARSVPEALDAVRDGDADAALVPIENSVGGQVGVTLDELANGEPLVITREVVIPVEFVLAARPEIRLDLVRSVAAHPQASAQCRRWLRAHLPDATVIDVLSNATAAQDAASGVVDAAICAPIAVGRYRISLLADKIADHPDGMTRFALVSRPGTPPAPTGDDLTSLAVYIAHDRVGALLEVLTQFTVRGVNLTRIESRPTGERLGRYVFFLDCAGHVADARVGEALAGLRRICADVRFLGSYPRAVPTGTEPPVASPAGLSDVDYADSAAWLSRVRAGGH
ncbi:prephenate dehydratase [Allocatelliglobosispora scoriae]|uniref:Prephenate dehydratase n=1 Tax=Allocatelliglobosispora scoriae TaxID=643052 RepID=A0A841BRQ6_9ACTN|nr:prephenate dehydratase [Allocatelliglobosispora scoriae]MBB5870924.1 prephenate dehydratase [Allocatelliglobosispora scoriae]